MLLSIIVPVYNVEKYLPDCLDSLLMQNIAQDEYEIVCVNDGAKDSSPAILNEYAAKHANIRVINKQNGGVSSARNVGIEHAKGDYLWFVDSDDCIAPNCLGEIADLISAHQPQLIKLDWRQIEENFDFAGSQEPPQQNPAEFAIYEKTDLASHWRRLICAAWGMIVQRALIVDNGLRFHEDMKYAEDTLLVFETYMHLTGIWIRLHKTMYLYRQVSTSAVHDLSPAAYERRTHDRIIQFRVIKSYFGTEFITDPKLYRAINLYMYKTCYMWFHEIPHTTYTLEESIRMFKSEGILPLKLNLAFIGEQNTLKEKIFVLRNCILFRFVPLYKIFFKQVRNKYGK